MPRRTRIVLAALTALPMCFAGCASTASSEAECKPAQPGATHPVAVNSACPVVPEDDATGSDATVAYKGKTVAFCCPKCIGKWNAMTEAQKDAALAKVTVAK